MGKVFVVAPTPTPLSPFFIRSGLPTCFQHAAGGDEGFESMSPFSGLVWLHNTAN